MRFLFALAISLLFASVGYSQSFVLQNAASFENEAGSDPSVVAFRSHISLYPTVSNFDISGTATLQSPYAYSVVTSGGDEIRVISNNSGGSDHYQRVTYVSASQINIVAENACCLDCGACSISLTSPARMHVQKKISGTWTTIRTLSSYNFVGANPHSFVSYASGSSQADADLYAFDGSSDYFFLKKVLDGDPNPKTYNGRPTVVSLYLTGAAASIFTGSFCGDLKLGGSSYTPVGGFANSSYYGVQQLNFEVPSTMSSSTTIQMGARPRVSSSCGDAPINYGNTTTIPNWQ